MGIVEKSKAQARAFANLQFRKCWIYQSSRIRLSANSLERFMRALYKTTALIAASVAIIGLSACGGSKAPEKLILGNWVQADDTSMTQEGMTITIKDGEANYRADGTSNGGGTMVLGDVPEEMATYVLRGESTWSFNDGNLVETMNSATVKPGSDNPNAVAIATQMEQQVTLQGATTSEIIKLTKDELILRDMESDITMTYKRK